MSLKQFKYNNENKISWPERIERRRLDQTERQDAYVKAKRWSGRMQAVVHHPAHGSVTVPCLSRLEAIECAADVWGVARADILMDAEVRAIDH